MGGCSVGADPPRCGAGLDGRLRKLLFWRPGKCQHGAAAGRQRLVRFSGVQPFARGAGRLDHPRRRHSGSQFGGAGGSAGGRRGPVAPPRSRLWPVVPTGLKQEAAHRFSGGHHGNVAEGIGVWQLGLQFGDIEMELLNHVRRQCLEHVGAVGNLVRQKSG